MSTKKDRKTIVGQLAVLAAIVATVAITGAGAPTITTSEYAQYDAEIILSNGNLTITPKGVDAIPKDKTALGDTQGTAITMVSTGNPIGRTALTKGNWGYKAEIQAITTDTPATTDFRIDLKVNGTITGTLYVSSDASPATGEIVTLTFDLGTAALGSEQSFVILATQL